MFKAFLLFCLCLFSLPVYADPYGNDDSYYDNPFRATRQQDKPYYEREERTEDRVRTYSSDRSPYELENKFRDQNSRRKSLSDIAKDQFKTR